MKLNLQLPANDTEFDSMMRYVDERLQEAGLFPPQRPLKAFLEVSHSLGLGLMMPAPKRAPRTGVFTGHDMTIRIFNWYDSHYGDKLGMHWGLARVVLMIRDEPWIASFPKVFGSVRFILDTSTPKRSDGIQLGRNSVPCHNVLDSIEGLPRGLRSGLTPDEQNTLFSQYVEAYHNVTMLADCLEIGMCREVLSDIESTVDHLAGSLPHYGQSRWSSLQAAEKIIKTYIGEHGAKFPHSHELCDLVKLAIDCGLKTIDTDALRRIQCGASVRYEDAGSTLANAYSSHWEAVRVVGLVCGQMLDTAAASGLT